MGQFFLFFFASIGVFAGLFLAIYLILFVFALLFPDSDNSEGNSTSVSEEEKLLRQLQSLLDQIENHFLLGEWRSVESDCRYALGIARKLGNSDAVRTINGLCGFSLLFQGEFSSAISFLNHSRKEASDFYRKAIANYSEGQYYSCIEDCLEVSEQTKDFTPALWLRGLARLKIGDRTLALDEFKKAVAIEKNRELDFEGDHHAYYFRAFAYEFAKKKKKAMEDANKALELAIQNKDSFYSEKSRLLLKKITTEPES